jgi:hypothetical protein
MRRFPVSGLLARHLQGRAVVSKWVGFRNHWGSEVVANAHKTAMNESLTVVGGPVRDGPCQVTWAETQTDTPHVQQC